MIRPRNRFIFWISTATPFMVMAAWSPLALFAAVVIAMLLLALAVLDAIVAFRRLRGMTLELPGTLRMTRKREGIIPVLFRSCWGVECRVRIGLPLPAGVLSGDMERIVVIPGGAVTASVEWPCMPLRRGIFRMDRFYLGMDSPLGFWTARISVSGNVEIRVYPNLMGESNELASLFLKRGDYGSHAYRCIGQGREFEKLREYIPGDGYDVIHWKATAKRGRPVSKVFQVERTQEVYVAIDYSRLSARPFGATVLLEQFVGAAMVLGLASEQQGDMFGVLAFSDRVTHFVKAGGGRQHFGACRDAIFAIEPDDSTPDFDDFATFLRLRLRRRSLVIVLTDLSEPLLAETFRKKMSLVSRQHIVLAGMVPVPGARPLFSEPDARNLDDVYRRLGGHMAWSDINQLDRALSMSGVKLLRLDDVRMSAQLVSQYMDIKRRQIL